MAADKEATPGMTPGGLFVTRWGPEDGVPIVLIHGSGQGSRISGCTHFKVQEQLKHSGFLLIVPDRPGHGRSPRPANGRGDDAELDGKLIADELFDLPSGRKVHVVGHSFGGNVALAACALRPDKVASLTLIEPAMMPLAPFSLELLWMGLQMLVHRYILSRDPADYAAFFIKLVAVPKELRGGTTREELRLIGEGLLRMRLPSRADYKSWFDTIKAHDVPRQVISGDWGGMVVTVTRAVAKHADCRVVVIPSPDHGLQNIEEFNRNLSEFVTAVDTRE